MEERPMEDHLRLLFDKLFECLNGYYKLDDYSIFRINELLVNLMDFSKDSMNIGLSVNDLLISFRDKVIPEMHISEAFMFYKKRIINILIKIESGENTKNWKYERHLKRYPLSEYYENLLAEYSSVLYGLTDSSKYCYLTNVRRFLSVLEKKEINTVSLLNKKDVYQTLYEMMTSKHGLDKSTFKCIRKFIEFLISSEKAPQLKGILLDSRASSPVIYNKKNFTQEQLMEIIQCIDKNTSIGKRDYAIMMIALNTLLRSVDIASLTLEDFYPDKKEIALKCSKNGKIQRFELSPKTVDAVIDYIENGRPETEDRHLFIRSRRPYIAISRKGTIQSIFLKLRNMTSIDHELKDGLTFHGIRRSVASLMVGNNEDIYLVAEILGHNEISATKLYTQLDASLLKECSLSFEGIEIRKGIYSNEPE